MAHTKEQLEKLLKEAFNYESREKHGKGDLQTEYAGTVQTGNRLRDVYIDTEGNSWYKLRFMTDRGPVTEYEYIFGHRESQTRLRERKYG